MRILFVFAGLLEYKGRLLKQIASLQDAGHECILIHGQKENTPPDYSNYPFEVHSFKQIRRQKKLNNFFSHLRFNFQAARLASQLHANAIVCVELTGALAGALVRVFHKNVMFVFDSNELFMEMGMKKLKKIVWGPIHSLAFKKADVILHAEQNRLVFCKQHYQNSAKHVLLENLPRIEINSFERQSKTTPIRIVYLGALIPSRHCEEIISAFSFISEDFANCDFIGFGEEEYINHLQLLISDNNLSNIRILPPISNTLMLEALIDYDIGLAFYKNNNLNQYYCAPNKIYDYIVTGLSVITNDYPGLLEVIEQNNIGVCLDSINPEAIAAAIATIASEEISENITLKIKQRYTWKNQEKAYISIFS